MFLFNARHLAYKTDKNDWKKTISKPNTTLMIIKEILSEL